MGKIEPTKWIEALKNFLKKTTKTSEPIITKAKDTISKAEAASKTLWTNWKAFPKEYPFVTFGGGVGTGVVGSMLLGGSSKTASLNKEAKTRLAKEVSMLGKTQTPVEIAKKLGLEVKDILNISAKARVGKDLGIQLAKNKPVLPPARPIINWKDRAKALAKKYPKSVTAGGTALGIGGLHALFGGD